MTLKGACSVQKGNCKESNKKSIKIMPLPFHEFSGVTVIAKNYCKIASMFNCMIYAYHSNF